VGSVAAALGARAAPATRHRIVWLDTFDWRLWRKGIVLEWIGARREGRLRLREPGGCRIDFEVPVAAAPRRPTDLPQAGLRARLDRLVHPRVLLPVAEAGGRLARLDVLNADEKTVLRLELRDERVDPGGEGDARTQRLIQLLPVRGYVRALREAVHRLRAEFEAQHSAMDPLLLALAARGRAPGDYSNKLDLCLDPGERADQALKRILLRLLEIIERNEPGVREDLDPEFLHDYRVAWRRTRSLLSQVKRVFPQDTLARFTEELRWLSAMTSPVRDMDVYLLEFDGYRASIDEALRPGLDPLHTLLEDEKRRTHAALVEALTSRRYERFKAEWRAFLQSPPSAYTTLKNAARPVIQVASRRIWKVFRRVLAEGRAIDESSPPEDLHELRKSCKKLRYLLEAFSSLYPKAPMQASIRDLKRLQDNLGEYQDLAVHRAALLTFRKRLEDSPDHTELTDQAIDALIESFDRRALEVRKAFAERFAGFDSKPVRKRFRALFKEGSRA
jgi:CHAD domain-containing protein